MRIVIKIGTSTLTYQNGCMNLRRIEALCRGVSDLKNAGNQVILVSSGAIAMGVGKLHLTEKPKDLAGKQACAAVGQCELMYAYDKLFAEYNHTVAQLLLTAPDLLSEDRHEKVVNTVNRLLELSVLPIINENDTVSTAEIEFGDNDTLSARVAASVGADLLVLLSDIEGLYTADPHKDPNAVLLHKVTAITQDILDLAGVSSTTQGTGGMVTKLRAAQICLSCGCDMVIANGHDPENLYAILDGNDVGTRFTNK